MAIATLTDYASALKERIIINKTLTVNTGALDWWSAFDGTGSPGAMSAISNTANGVVPTDSTAGAPTINFSSGSGYITSVEATCSYASRITVYDRLFHAGAYAFNASTTLASQPSYSSRVPGGTDYTGLQLWFEGASTFTGLPTVTVTYTNQGGTPGQSTSLSGISFVGGNVPGPERSKQFPLASGDSGLSKIESVTATVASAGTFNVFVARPLFTVRIPRANIPVILPIEQLGAPQVWTDSALFVMTQTDGNTNPAPRIELNIEIASA